MIQYQVLTSGLYQINNYFVSIPFGEVLLIGNPPNNVIDNYVSLGYLVKRISKYKLNKYKL